MSTLVQDIRFALRTLRKRPGFTAAAVLTLALGIGSNTAIFTVFDRALLRPLPVAEPDRLVILKTLRDGGRLNVNFSVPEFRDYRERSEALAGLLAFTRRSFTLTSGGGAERVNGEGVSPEYFDLLGVDAALGRTFAADEERAPVAVLGHAFWQRRFGGDPGVIGRTITLNDQPLTVVGIAPEAFRGLERGVSRDVWLPLGALRSLGTPESRFSRRNVRWLYLVGRLAPGIDRAQAQQELSLLFDRLEAETPSGELGLVIEPGARGYARAIAEYTRPLAVLMGFVGLVLLIACANVANLLLARARERRGEIAVRLSLGATPGRLVRQLFTESAVLGVLGAVAGVVLALWGADVLLRFRPVTGEALSFDMAPDARVLGFTLAVAAFAVVASGLAPTWRASRPDLAAALRSATPRAGGGRRLGLRGGLVAGQVALSLVILVGAGLLVQSLRNLSSVDLGYAQRDALLASLDLGDAGYGEADGLGFYDRVRDRVAALPGVETAAIATSVTPSPAGSNWSGFVLEGYDAAPDETIAFDLNWVSAGFFETLEMPIVRGRAFDARDAAGAPPTVIVDERIAQRYWPDSDPVGRRIRLGTDADAWSATVVGVAAAGRYRGVRADDGLMLYVPMQQWYASDATLVVHGAGEPASLASAVRGAVRDLDASLPLYDVRTLENHLDAVLARDHLVAALSLAFGVLALVLTALGVYAIMTQLALRRTREVGIRMALGATRADVLLLIVRGGGWPIAAGLAIGLAGAAALARLLSSLLYEMGAIDPLSFGAAAVGLGAAALAASYLPARRAARVDPIEALRQE